MSSEKKKKGAFREYTEAILTAVLIALVIRSFVLEAFKIPSSSMVPTLLIGDHIFVNKFSFGLRIPFTKLSTAPFSKLKHGDVVVFMYPKDESKDFIKRVIGLPGDHVTVEGANVYVNGVEFKKTPLVVTNNDSDRRLEVQGSDKYKEISAFPGWQNYDFFEEIDGEAKHIVQYGKSGYHRSVDINVPEGHIFVMGDNRDNSSDSREWGFVPIKNLKGKAMFVWLSLDHDEKNIRFSNIGNWID